MRTKVTPEHGRPSSAHSTTKPRRAATGRWLCAAIGDKGDHLDWKEPFEVLEDIRWLFGLLEDFGEQNTDVPKQIAGLPVFEGLSRCSFPPLYNEADFDEILGMRYAQRMGWREDRWVGFSAAEVRIFIWSRERAEVLSQARVLRRRLQNTLEEYEQMKAANNQRSRKRKTI